MANVIYPIGTVFVWNNYLSTMSDYWLLDIDFSSDGNHYDKFSWEIIDDDGTYCGIMYTRGNVVYDPRGETIGVTGWKTQALRSITATVEWSIPENVNTMMLANGTFTLPQPQLSPTTISVEDLTLTINEVENATSYDLLVNGEVRENIEASVEFVLTVQWKVRFLTVGLYCDGQLIDTVNSDNYNDTKVYTVTSRNLSVYMISGADWFDDGSRVVSGDIELVGVDDSLMYSGFDIIMQSDGEIIVAASD